MKKKISNFFSTLEKVSKIVLFPMCKCGGISSIDCVKDLLRAGADKVLITTNSYKKKFYF